MVCSRRWALSTDTIPMESNKRKQVHVTTYTHTFGKGHTVELVRVTTPYPFDYMPLRVISNTNCKQSLKFNLRMESFTFGLAYRIP